MQSPPTVFVIDDDEAVRTSLHLLLETGGYKVATFPSGKAFFDTVPAAARGCILVDVRMPEMSGIEVQQELEQRGIELPVIIMTGHADVPLAVRAMKAGALDFIEKPFSDELISSAIERALGLDRSAQNERAARTKARDLAAQLTPREREVLEYLVVGHPNKVIAHKMSISPRTVEIHRARVMEKMQARSLSELVRMSLAARLASNAGA